MHDGESLAFICFGKNFAIEEQRRSAVQKPPLFSRSSGSVVGDLIESELRETNLVSGITHRAADKRSQPNTLIICEFISASRINALQLNEMDATKILHFYALPEYVSLKILEVCKYRK